nr:hybrid signal transduction histidine kinase M [Tanacetum cinerariifolium]
MAAGDAPPQPPPNTDKIIPFSIPNKVPIKLDLEKHNYNSWSSFSLIHLGSLGLKSHVEDDTASTNPDWCQLDDLIKMWILFSLCDSLQEQLVTTPGNAKALWDHLKDLTSSTFDGSSSSPTALVTSTSSTPKGSSSKSPTLPQLCNHFNKGTCRFGDRCKYIHDHRNRMGLSSTRNQSHNTASSHAGVWNMDGIQHKASAPHVSSYRPSYNSTAGPTAFYTDPVHYSSQPHPLETTLPSAFSTMTLQDLTWNMDTGSSSHLNSNVSNLRTVFNQRLFPSVHVGDGNSIPVINTGDCTIPSAYRPLHLHNVLVTPNIIKNLIYVRQFTRDNNCTIEFDAFGFSVKDFWTRHILL